MKKLIFNNLFLFIFILNSSVFSQNNTLSQNSKNTQANKYIPNTIIIKIKKQYKDICSNKKIKNNEFEDLLISIKTQSVTKKFPQIHEPKQKFNKNGNKLVDISLIYELKYKSNTPINKIISQLKSNDIIEYAQPHYLPKLLYTPNDSLNINQYYLNTIQAFEAWDICKGDSTIVIGITDTGVDIDHEDLEDNIFYNNNDSINGIDDDNDGFTDNFRGWDLGENDNNPQVEDNKHGIYVSGIAAATTDNGKGISGVGFNTKFLPVKISNQNSELTMAYEGIVYAAEHGCSIINCSWGSTVKDQYGQDIVNYATFNKNALIIAAAGNSNNDDLFYPASYENVISVAGTDENDIKWTGTTSGSNYGIYVDICAPGMYIYTTDNNNNYIKTYWGTSFSAPIVAGCAAIAKSFYPDYTALQIGELLKATADKIDDKPENLLYQHKLGSGRVNLFKALSDSIQTSINFSNVSYSDNNDNKFVAGDTILITGIYTSYLSQVSNTTVTLTSSSDNIEITNNTNFIDTLNTLDTISNRNNPFAVKILPEINYDENIVLRLNYDYGNHQTIQYIDFNVNPSFINIDTNNISTTITSTGNIGFTNTPDRSGIGFIYKKSENLIFEGGLLIGNSAQNMTNCIRGSNDFEAISLPEIINDNTAVDYNIQTIFNDNKAEDSKLGLKILQNTYAWDNEKDADYVIYEYLIINENAFDINNLYVGLFADWDITFYNKNRIDFDKNLNLAYTYSTQSPVYYTGIQLLSGTPINHYAIDNIEGGNGGVDITNGFSTEEKWFTMTNERNSAGNNSDTSDVADVLSTGPFNINSEDTVKIAFALLSNENLYNLKNSAVYAQEKYFNIYNQNNINDINKNLFEVIVYPNPTNENTEIEFYSSKNGPTELKIINSIGNTIFIKRINYTKTGKNIIKIKTSEISNGIYFIKLKTENKTISKKLLIIH
ncbi:MAG: S8 family peptidase [Bacteroidales bacterium]|nr:S8 family peptidase [Bacteroidales bacterium]